MSNVLILEDDELHRKVIQILCKRLNCSVAMYSKPSHAIEQDMITHADLIICDYNMEDETALVLLEYLKSNDIHKKVIINSGNPSCMNEINEKGYASFVTKYTCKFISLSLLKKYL
jgi:DNA-binding NtrC family response regulator